MALCLLVTCLLAAFVGGEGGKHMLYMRHVESKQNWGADSSWNKIGQAIKTWNNCRGNEDSSPSGSHVGHSKKGHGVIQIQYVLRHFGEKVGELYRSLFSQPNWSFETSTLKRAQVIYCITDSPSSTVFHMVSVLFI